MVVLSAQRLRSRVTQRTSFFSQVDVQCVNAVVERSGVLTVG